MYSDTVQEVPVILFKKKERQLVRDPNHIVKVQLKRYNPKLHAVNVELERNVEFIHPETLSEYRQPHAVPTAENKRVTARRLDLNAAQATVEHLKQTLERTPLNGKGILHERKLLRPQDRIVEVAGGIEELDKRHHNSWLLSVNYHLVKYPEIMQSLPWLREGDGTIPFLPPGSQLPGVVASRDLLH